MCSSIKREVSTIFFVRMLLRIVHKLFLSSGELEIELEKVLMERSDFQETLLKTENLALSLEADKRHLQDDLKKVF